MPAICTTTRWISASHKHLEPLAPKPDFSNQHEDGGLKTSVFFKCCGSIQLSLHSEHGLLLCNGYAIDILRARYGPPSSGGGWTVASFSPGSALKEDFCNSNGVNLCVVGHSRSNGICSVLATAGCHPRATTSRLRHTTLKLRLVSNEHPNLRSLSSFPRADLHLYYNRCVESIELVCASAYVIHPIAAQCRWRLWCDKFAKSGDVDRWLLYTIFIAAHTLDHDHRRNRSH